MPLRINKFKGNQCKNNNKNSREYLENKYLNKFEFIELLKKKTGLIVCEFRHNFYVDDLGGGTQFNWPRTALNSYYDAGLVLSQMGNNFSVNICD